MEWKHICLIQLCFANIWTKVNCSVCNLCWWYSPYRNKWIRQQMREHGKTVNMKTSDWDTTNFIGLIIVNRMDLYAIHQEDFFTSLKLPDAFSDFSLFYSLLARISWAISSRPDNTGHVVLFTKVTNNWFVVYQKVLRETNKRCREMPSKSFKSLLRFFYTWQRMNMYPD